MKLLRLIRLQLNVNLGITALLWNRTHNPKRFWSGVGLAALVAVGFAPLVYLYYRMMQQTYVVAESLGQPEVILAVSVVLASLLVLVLGFAYVMSVLYYSSDLSMLVPLPLKSTDILGAKFAVILLFEYLTVFPFYFPALWVYGLNVGAGVGYWFSGLLIFFLLPIIPLALVSAVVVVMMRVTNLSHRRDTWRFVSMIFIMVVVLGFNFGIGSLQPGDEAEMLAELLLSEEGLLRMAVRTYPPALQATRALTQGGLAGAVNGLWFLGLSGMGVGLMFLIGQRMFYQGLIGGSEVRPGKAVSEKALSRRMNTATSPVWAIAMREIRYLIRTPIYLFNSLAMVAIVPLLMIVPMISAGSLTELIQSLDEYIPRVFQVLGGGAFVGMMAIFGPAASSSFSREGALFWVSKIIPVSAEQQVQGKLLYSLILAAVALPVLVVMAVFLLQWGIWDILLASLAGMVVSVPIILSALLLDLSRPYLTWDNPQQAIKQNLNVVFGMITGALIFLALFGVGQLTYRVLDQAGPVYYVVVVTALLMGAVLYGVLKHWAPIRYQNIEM